MLDARLPYPQRTLNCDRLSHQTPNHFPTRPNRSGAGLLTKRHPTALQIREDGLRHQNWLAQRSMRAITKLQRRELLARDLRITTARALPSVTSIALGFMLSGHNATAHAPRFLTRSRAAVCWATCLQAGTCGAYRADTIDPVLSAMLVGSDRVDQTSMSNQVEVPCLELNTFTGRERDI
jgi:hypothetical protein